MESGSLYAQIIVYSWVLINIGLSLILGSKMSMMLWVINWMQLVWYLPLMTSYFPKHVKIMYSLLSFANMDIQIFSDAFKRLTYIASDEMYPFNQRFENNDISSMLFFDNSASILFSMLLTVWSLMLAITLYLISCFPKCKKVAEIARYLHTFSITRYYFWCRDISSYYLDELWICCLFKHQLYLKSLHISFL